jgi:hypothetical protein
MVSTFTYTSTKTFTRTVLIKTQFRFLLSETTDISKESLEKVIERGIDKKWLSKVAVYALDSNNLCHGQIQLTIDWDIHNNEMAIENATIHLNKPWKGKNQDTSPGVSEVVSKFNEFVEENLLTTIWRFDYADNVDQDSIRKEIGSVTTERPSWKKNKAGENQRLSKLNELAIGYYYATE